MRRISIHSNKLTGRIPHIHEKYEIIWLNTNSFSGSLPLIDCEMSSLRSLKLFDNQLNGSIPGSIVNCTKLKYLFLDKNQLSGTIPPKFFTLPDLGFIDLS